MAVNSLPKYCLSRLVVNLQISANYRPDIEGLRGIAILSILFFHAGFHTGFPGGFVGVDIFFVISGYLLTKSIIHDLKQKTFSFKTFYTRRARRLLPALLLVLSLSFLTGFLLLTPRYFAEMASSAFFALFAIANFFFIGRTGYFDIKSAYQPLLHTWALSIEEQFILLWPLTLLLLLKQQRNIKNKTIISVIIIACLVSLVMATIFEASTSSYYFTPSRVYEFMFGAILVFLPVISLERMREAVFILGVSLITFSIVKYSSAMHFPSYYALLPTMGAALIIAANNPVFSGQLLNNSLMIFIGKISYSIYLVHWPIGVFMFYLTVGQRTRYHGIYVIILSLTLAFFMYVYVERPFRYNKDILYRRFFLIVPVMFFVMAILFLSVWFNKGYPWRYPGKNVSEDRYKLADQEETIYRSENLPIAPLQKPVRKNILVVGDSHSYDVFLALATNRDLIPNINLHRMFLDEQCFKATSTFASGILKFFALSKDSCAKDKKAIIESPYAKSANMVIIATHVAENDTDCLPGMIKFHRGYSGAEIVVFGVNLLPFDPQAFFARLPSYKNINNIFYDIDRSSTIKLNQDSKAISEQDGARYFDIYSLICNQHDHICRIVNDQNTLLYFNADHWTFEGKKYFGKIIIENGLLGAR